MVESLEVIPIRFDSQSVPGHYYEVIERIGSGSQGDVSLVLRYNEDKEATGLYACKFIK